MSTPAAIALIGPSGSGKSNIGKIIAEKLKWQFIDSDREIEEACGKTIAQIFRDSGEAEFRNQESSFIEKLQAQNAKDFVLSTGGGMPIFADNFSRLQSMAVLVYLSAPLEVLVTRIKFGEERPLLGSGGSAPTEEAARAEAKLRLEKLIAERESIYNRARYRIDTSQADAEQLADDIIRLVGVS
jgi:shikimate kinase